jgi:hypothetical protein
MLLFGLLLLGGCAPQQPTVTSAQEERLTRLVVHMDREIDPAEAKRLAHEALVFSRELAVRYRVATSPWVHNFLVNVGIRDRGLCYQWADDLMAHLNALHLKTLTLYPVGTHIGEYWSEHNAIAVFSSRHVVPLEHAILLDPWRHSGQLFFSTTEADTRYHWQIRRDRIIATTDLQPQQPHRRTKGSI